MIKMRGLFVFVNDIEIIYCLASKLILNNNDSALFRVNAGAGAIDSVYNIETYDILWRVPSIDPINDNRVIVQKGLNRKNNIVFRYYERHFIGMCLMLLTSYLI